ncbi:serine hydrolase [Streptomyces daliensis]
MPRISRCRALPAAAALLALTATMSCEEPGKDALAARASGSPSASSGRSSASPSPEPSPSVDLDRAVREALEALPESSGSYAVAVEDVESGESVVHGAKKDSETFDCASIVKVDILAALLLRTQDRDSHLTAEQKRLASAMIRSSDNTAADALWQAIGGAPGLDAANKRLGLEATTGGTNLHWGLTQTTAGDQLALLQAVFGEDSPLSADSREYIRTLMTGVVEGQRWGVSAAAEAETTVALKNGWLPRSATGLWDVNSIGRIESDGRTLLIAVLSDGQPSHRTGIDLVEKVSTTAVRALLGT